MFICLVANRLFLALTHKTRNKNDKQVKATLKIDAQRRCKVNPFYHRRTVGGPGENYPQVAPANNAGIINMNVPCF